MPKKLTKEFKNKIRKILRKNGIVRAGIFGSYARGEQKKKSDIDVLVKIKDKKMSLIGFIHIKHELEDALGRKVDMVEYAAIKPLIKDKILSEEVRII